MIGKHNSASDHSTLPLGRAVAALLLSATLTIVAPGCGKTGDPLPPEPVITDQQLASNDAESSGESTGSATDPNQESSSGAGQSQESTADNNSDEPDRPYKAADGEWKYTREYLDKAIDDVTKEATAKGWSVGPFSTWSFIRGSNPEDTGYYTSRATMTSKGYKTIVQIHIERDEAPRIFVDINKRYGTPDSSTIYSIDELIPI